MSWLDAHDTYVMDVIARDRMNDLVCAADIATEPTEPASTPADAPTAPRHAGGARPVVPAGTLAKVWR